MLKFVYYYCDTINLAINTEWLLLVIFNRFKKGNVYILNIFSYKFRVRNFSYISCADNVSDVAILKYR